ncbi:hypothetical protein Vretifemale_17004 [Volvox reticuliferus]|nr:hypothetical protein Vretifemale_17004 [Volvox reticuliferus]
MFNVITYNVSGLMGSWPPRFVHTVRTGRRYPWSPASCRASMTGAGRIAEEHHLVDRDGIFTCPSRRLVDSRHRPMLAPVRRNRNTHRRRATFPWLHASSSGPLSVARRAADSCSQLPIAVGCIRRNIPRGGGNHPYPHGSSRSSSSRRRSPGSHFTGSDRGQGATMCRAGVLEGFSGVSNLMAPEFATVFSAVIAITSVSINLYGGLLTEKRRADLAREVERERQAMAAQDEERSVVARYRGPLLEATVDLEARLYHIATLTGEWRSGDVVCEEEVVYTLFTLAQWLGFLEVIRREGPRERSFLQRGGGSAAAAGGGGGGGGGGGVSTGGADTLTTLVEGFRFVLSAHPATLRKWYEQGDGREHPGCRSRAMMLRGTPALPDDWLGAEGNGRGVWRERPPPPQLTTGGQQSGAIPAGLRLLSGGGGSGGSATASYGRGPGGGAPQPPWSSGGRHGTVPPPTKPVVLRHRSGLGPVSGGPGAVTGPAGGSELLIGSLDEHDLAAAGLGLPDLDTGYDLGQFMTPGRSGGCNRRFSRSVRWRPR